MKSVALKTNGSAHGNAFISAEGGTVKMEVTHPGTGAVINLEFGPDSAIALASAFLAAAREAVFTRLEELTGKEGAQ